jgi:hypothetical protein
MTTSEECWGHVRSSPRRSIRWKRWKDGRNIYVTRHPDFVFVSYQLTTDKVPEVSYVSALLLPSPFLDPSNAKSLRRGYYPTSSLSREGLNG